MVSRTGITRFLSVPRFASALLTGRKRLWYVHIVNVHNMNKERAESQDTFKSLQLLDEISKGEPLSQRDLSKRLNIALGLVNSYIKNLVAKGYVTIRGIPAKRYTYYLTPKGFAEKSRLTYHLLQDYTNIFRTARKDFQMLFDELHRDGIRRIAFAGVDEVAEIAYLSLQETDIDLSGVFDDDKSGKDFFRNTVMPYEDLGRFSHEGVIITTYLKRDVAYGKLIENGVHQKKIHTIYLLANQGRRRQA